MVNCPKCGYTRTPKDDEFISEQECPRCGIVYEKFIKNVYRIDNRIDLNGKSEVDKTSTKTYNPNIFSFRMLSPMIIILMIAIVISASTLYFVKSNKTHPDIGIEEQNAQIQRQQQVIVCLNKIDCIPATLNSMCFDKCKNLFGDINIDQFIKRGWNIVSSAEQISTINLDKPDDSLSECSCISTKYFIEK